MNYPLFTKYVYWYNICLIQGKYYFTDAGSLTADNLLTMFKYFTVNDGIDAEQWYRKDEKDNNSESPCYVVPAKTVFDLLSARLEVAGLDKLKSCKEYDAKTDTFRFQAFAGWEEGLGVHGLIDNKVVLGNGVTKLYATIYGGDSGQPVFRNAYTIQEYNGGYRYLAVERLETYDEEYGLDKLGIVAY